MKKKKQGKEVYRLYQSFSYCMKIAWRASAFYTYLQIIVRLGTAMIPLAITWNTGRLIDFFGSKGYVAHPEKKLMLYMMIMLFLHFLRILLAKINTYVNGLHQDLLIKQIEMEMAQTASGMELKYFDNPQYYDAFETVKRDMYSLMTTVYDIISIISYLFSSFSCMIVLSHMDLLYTILLVVVCVPAAISEQTYTKKFIFGV